MSRFIIGRSRVGVACSVGVVLHGSPRYDGTCRYQARSTIQRTHAPHGTPTWKIQGSQPPCRMLQWRAASSSGNQPNGSIDSEGGDPGLSEAAPGVQQQEGQPRPSIARADGAADASDASTDGTESSAAGAPFVASTGVASDSAPDGAQQDAESAAGRGGRETYTEVRPPPGSGACDPSLHWRTPQNVRHHLRNAMLLLCNKPTLPQSLSIRATSPDCQRPEWHSSQ